MQRLSIAIALLFFHGLFSQLAIAQNVQIYEPDTPPPPLWLALWITCGLWIFLGKTSPFYEAGWWPMFIFFGGASNIN